MKRLVLLTIALLITCSTQTVIVSGQDQKLEDSHVLLLFDTLAIGSAKEGNVDELQRLLSSFSVPVTTLSIEQYEEDMIERYRYVIVLRNDDSSNADRAVLMKELQHYKGSYVHIGYDAPPFIEQKLHIAITVSQPAEATLTIGEMSAQLHLSDELMTIKSDPLSPIMLQSYGQLTSGMSSITASAYAVLHADDGLGYITHYERGNLTQWAASYMLSDWLGIKENGRMYLMLTDVYPFSDLEQLRIISDHLYDAGIPFIVSSHSLFNNVDYPAAQRYAETLKYMQSRNGSIIVHPPEVSSQAISADFSVLGDNIITYIDFLAQHGVAPLGTIAEMYWFKDLTYRSAGLSFYDSAIVLPNEKVMSRQPSDELHPLAHHLYSMELEQWMRDVPRTLIVENLPIAMTLSLSMLESEAVIEEQLEWLKQSWIVFHNYKLQPHKVATDQYEIRAMDGELLINGQALSMTDDYNDISSDYQYVEVQEASFQRLISFQNQMFIVIIMIVLLIFALLMFIGYRMYKRKYR